MSDFTSRSFFIIVIIFTYVCSSLDLRVSRGLRSTNRIDRGKNRSTVRFLVCDVIYGCYAATWSVRCFASAIVDYAPRGNIEVNEWDSKISNRFAIRSALYLGLILTRRWIVRLAFRGAFYLQVSIGSVGGTLRSKWWRKNVCFASATIEINSPLLPVQIWCTS